MVLHARLGEKSRGLIERLLDAVHGFTSGAEPSDDIALLALRRGLPAPLELVVTADQAGVMAEALAAGASSFLHKPISSTMLLSAVRRLTRHEC